MHCLIEPLLADLDSDDESDGGQSVQFVKATGDPKKPQIFGGQMCPGKKPRLSGLGGFGGILQQCRAWKCFMS